MAEPVTGAEAHIAALEQELEQREYEIELLKETATAVSSELNLDRVFQLIADRALKLIDAETLLIPILNPECDEYTYRAGAGRDVDEIVGETLPLDFGVCGWVWRNRRAWWRGVLDELSEEERNRWEKEAGTLILVPLVGREHFLGGIAGINKRGGGDFTRRDLNLLSLFASQAAIAIENAMAVRRLEDARLIAETYQRELRQVNSRLSAANQELEYLSLYDPLTALPNRSLFRDRLNQALQESQRIDSSLAVMVLDLDRFQDINDALGHDVGDQLLKQVSVRFAAELSHQDTLGRLGGDEFAVLLPNADAERVERLARALAQALENPFEIEGQELAVTASMGISLYPDHGQDSTDLMKHADTAMYVAKREHSGFSIFDPESEQDSAGRLGLVGDLRTALTREEFELHYQPKLDLKHRRIVGMEALARWQHRRRGFVPPDIFIPVLEQTGMIREFNYWALEAALRQCAAWREQGWNLKVAVNLPVTSLLEADFIDELEKIIVRVGVRDGLILEITENLFLSDYDRLTGILQELLERGVTFSIDDFGTGHSSLSRLRRLPVDELKIDRSFVMDMERNPDDATIVRSTIDLAHNLGRTVVAEGVENESIMWELARLGCDLVQGYHISKPLAAAELESFLRKSGWEVQTGPTAIPNSA
ncbi:MAG TPA: EAL domain-containing protein [Thiotrichales bacterium]|nr:EAL domain-containing protein [Thiotrichales bacterium]